MAIAPFLGDDLPDWVNPFVVKELRQGLRSRIFVTVFVALHTGVALVMGLGLLTDPGIIVPFNFSQGMQWTIEGACLCLLLPLGGFASVSDEMKADSLELIRVAGVTSGQIVLGKWQALIGQASLLVISVTPYHLLQYYLNHSSPLTQFISLYFCWLTSLFLGACTILFGTLKVAGRVGCLALGIPFGLVFLGFVIPATGGMISFFNDTIATLIITTVVWGSGVIFFLSLATSGVDMRVRANPPPLMLRDYSNTLR